MLPSLQQPEHPGSMLLLGAFARGLDNLKVDFILPDLSGWLAAMCFQRGSLLGPSKQLSILRTLPREGPGQSRLGGTPKAWDCSMGWAPPLSRRCGGTTISKDRRGREGAGQCQGAEASLLRGSKAWKQSILLRASVWVVGAGRLPWWRVNVVFKMWRNSFGV